MSDYWDAPIPLDEYDLPEFPVEALPEWLAAFVEALAIETETPTDLAGMIALGVLATAMQRRYVAEPKPGWVESLSLWLLPLLSSGERKSAVFGRLYQPVWDRQRELLAAGAPGRARAQAELASAESHLKKTITEASKGSASERITARAARDEASDEHERLLNEVPPEAVMMLDDVTPERLGQVMGDVGAVTIASDEGGVFSTFAGRYSAGVPNLDLLLKSHNGGTASIDRIKRGRTVIERPACTLAMAVQPDVLAEVTASSQFVERGGLARFLFAMPSSNLGKRTNDGQPVPGAIERAYTARILGLLPHEPPVKKADQKPNERVLRFESDAWSLMREFMARHEPRLHRDVGDLAWCLPWASKFPGALVRIAALIELASGHSESISLASTHRALLFAPYFEAHARAALGMAGEDEPIKDARVVLSWIRGKRCTEFSERDAYKARLKDDPDRGYAACEELCRRHYIAPIEEPENARPKGGRTPSQRWEVNPKVLEVVSVLSVVTEKAKQGSESLSSSSNSHGQAKTAKTILENLSNGINGHNGQNLDPRNDALDFKIVPDHHAEW